MASFPRLLRALQRHVVTGYILQAQKSPPSLRFAGVAVAGLSSLALALDLRAHGAGCGYKADVFISMLNRISTKLTTLYAAITQLSTQFARREVHRLHGF